MGRSWRVVSYFGALNGWTLIQGQIPMAAADDHLFMKVFSRKNKHGVPIEAIKSQKAFVILRNVGGKSKEEYRGYNENFAESTFDGNGRWFIGPDS